LSEVKNQHVCAILRRYVIEERVAPVATAGYGRPSATFVVGAAGGLPGQTRDAEASVDTIFDLASVSKPIVACCLARLAARGVLALEAPLGALLPEARGTRSARVPLELLLAHRAGLDAHHPLFAELFAGCPIRRSPALRRAADARRPECAGEPDSAGFPPIYSDLGYLLLGAAIEAVTGEPLDHVIQREVALPLGLALGSARQLLRQRSSFDRDVAPTEIVRARGGCVRGVVHDENAWALSGHAASGHAGLFGTVSDVLGFGAALLSALAGTSSWLSRAAVHTLTKPRPGGSLRAGFDGKSAAGSSAGARCGAETFGHLGFTGTSLWCDPSAGIVSVLLTNRVYPTRENPRIRAARPLVHDALFEAAKVMLPVPPNP
jgi:CubicO group peptidase (beta-lactamase class C family)